ncbi:DMT family transporter [Pigmentiphaga sp. H8]|uniref:DMT family transporter n=1 Tax=Pigmentiphaga sp. H8 TaxID=2488560 RepID=UPI000F5B02CE|nr:DMT family transporter [Pigmentiphaga sp. H8]AZG09308.1 DMT family transporter [Pigmentiphaga sp. H8]
MPATRLWNSAYFLLITTVLFWSGNFIVGRAAGGSVPPIALAFWRWAGGTLILLVLARRHWRADLPVIRRHLPILLLLSLLGIAGFNTLVYIGLRETSAVNALLMQSAIPMVTLLFSFMLLGQRASLAQIAGVAISLAGIAAIATRGRPQDLLAFALNPGDAWIVAAVAVWGLYTTLLARRPAIHPLSLLTVTFLMGTLMLLPLYLYEHAQGARIEAGLPSALAIAYVILLPGIVANFFYNRGVELIGAGPASLFIHLMPVFGTLLAVAFLGERVHLFHLAGIGLIATGIVLATVARRRAAARPVS